MFIIRKININRFENIDRRLYKISFSSIDLIEIQNADRIKLIYSEKEILDATIQKVDEDEWGRFLLLYLWDGSTLRIGKVNIELIFSPRKSIKGADRFIELHGYWSAFHDDYIKEIKMDTNGITLIIDMEVRKDQIFNQEIILKLNDIESMELSNWYCSNIIFEMIFKYKGEYIEVGIGSSLGLTGSILCKDISVEVN
ncbi:Imm50 family immunity protein [Clostridium sp.]|uniref:Imm50 family immunity protein n=1 Tax=Clostridium sp. TaxID=1506 RepID=UPI002FCA9474